MDRSERERRKAKRVELEIEIGLMSLNASLKVHGWIQDLSDSGFRLKTEIPSNFKKMFHKGDEIYFRTFEDFYEIKGRGEIVWISDEDDMVGIKFSAFDDESKKALEDFLRICLKE